MQNRRELLESLPPQWPDNLLADIQKMVADRTVVVLDDDPTGTQTVHGVPVLAEWSMQLLRDEFAAATPCFYILTNSRSLSLPDAQALNAEIGHNLRSVSQETKRSFVVVSRSDSTLRGHFPGEVDALVETLDVNFDATLIIPYFLEGGRYTINDIHYVAEGDNLIPAAETPYAQDASFGYRSSNLREWVVEKTAGRVRLSDVASVSIEDIRRGGPQEVARLLLALQPGAVCVVNAATYGDLEVFVRGLLEAEAQGRQFVYRTAASFVRVRAGIEPRPLLTLDDLDLPAEGGGLFVVGSYVPKTTAQLSALLERANVSAVEISVTRLLQNATQETTTAVAQINAALADDRDVVLYTSRDLITGDDADTSLRIGQRVSDGLISVVRSLEMRPRYIVAKGGITSSDVATRGLHVRRAMVMGQVLPGVPVWQLDENSRFPGMTYVVFPGNVGATNALASIQATFRVKGGF